MIVGERVTLRPLEPADVDPLNAIIAEPEVRRWWGTDPTVDDQDAFTIVVGGELAGWLGWYEETDRRLPPRRAGHLPRDRASTGRGSAARRCGWARTG